MLFLVTGASGSGKTACMPHVRTHLPNLPLHDFDERGVPADADKVWRQEQSETWVRLALDYQAAGRDMILFGQVVFGEILACPSADELDGLYACLLDCHDITRLERLRRRGTHGATQDMLCWAVWQRIHAVDPQWRPDVIRDGGWTPMRWARWSQWARGDQRWRTWTMDTTALSIQDVAERVANWVNQIRSGQVPDGI